MNIASDLRHASEPPRDHESGVDAVEVGDSSTSDDEPGSGSQVRIGARSAIVVGLLATLALAVVGGSLAFRAYEARNATRLSELFLQVAREGAIDLTTISYTDSDAGVQRILDSTTGTFHDDFQERAQPLIAVFQQAQTISAGTVTEAGLESMQGDGAQVLIAITVKTSNSGAESPEPSMWRMRIGVEKVGDGAKISNVEFVP